MKQKKSFSQRWKKRGLFLLILVGIHSILRLTVPYVWEDHSAYHVSTNGNGRCSISVYDTYRYKIQFDSFSPWLFLTIDSPYAHFRVHDLVSGRLLADSRQLIPTPTRYGYFEDANLAFEVVGFEARGASIPLGEEDLIWKGFSVCREENGLPKIANVGCNLLRLRKNKNEPEACREIKKYLDAADTPSLYGFVYSLGIVALNFLSLPNIEPLGGYQPEVFGLKRSAF